MRSAVSLLVIVGLVAFTVAAVLLTSVDSEGRPGTAEASHGNVDVAVGSLFFGTTGSMAWDDTGDPGTFEETTIDVGDSITWTPWSFTHSVAGCDPNTAWLNCPEFLDFSSGAAPIGNSGSVAGGGSYGPITFNTAGEYPYLCTIHPGSMRGKIVVLAAPTPAPTPAPAPTPTPTPTPQPTPQPSPPAAIPAGGGEPPSDGGASLLWWLAVGTGTFLVASAAALMLRR